MQCKQESETVPLPSKAQIMFKLIKTQFVSAAAFGLVCHQIYLFVRKLPAGLCSLFLFFYAFKFLFISQILQEHHTCGMLILSYVQRKLHWL